MGKVILSLEIPVEVEAKIENGDDNYIISFNTFELREKLFQFLECKQIKGELKNGR